MSKGSSGHFNSGHESSQNTDLKSNDTSLKKLSKYQLKLIKEVQAKGEKITPKNVLEIGKNKYGRIVWIEIGTNSAGLKHILEKHGEQFKKSGFTPKSLSNFLVKTVLTKQVVGYIKTRSKNPRPVYKVTVNGKTKYIAISVGLNGFIVGANFVSERRIIWNR